MEKAEIGVFFLCFFIFRGRGKLAENCASVNLHFATKKKAGLEKLFENSFQKPFIDLEIMN